MARSSYKLPSLFSKNSIGLLKTNSSSLKTLLAKSFLKKKPQLIVNKNFQVIYPSLVNKRALVYCGNLLSLISFKKSMIGFPVKNFIRTKKTGSVIHIEKRSKKKK